MRVARTAICASIVAAGLVFIAGPAQAAWDPNAAAAYADTYATTRNGAYPSFGDDCTNFVSQAIRQGGHPQKGTVSGLVLADDSQWWMNGTGPARTYSWSVANDLETFFSVYDTHADSGHAQYQGAANTMSSPPSPVTKGDVVFYKWDSRNTSTRFDHAAILVGTGVDPDGAGGHYSGALVDEHTNDRYHAIWNLYPYNATWQYTTTVEFHLS